MVEKLEVPLSNVLALGKACSGSAQYLNCEEAYSTTYQYFNYTEACSTTTQCLSSLETCSFSSQYFNCKEMCSATAQCLNHGKASRAALGGIISAGVYGPLIYKALYCFCYVNL